MYVYVYAFLLLKKFLAKFTVYKLFTKKRTIEIRRSVYFLRFKKCPLMPGLPKRFQQQLDGCQQQPQLQV